MAGTRPSSSPLPSAARANSCGPPEKKRQLPLGALGVCAIAHYRISADSMCVIIVFEREGIEMTDHRALIGWGCLNNIRIRAGSTRTRSIGCSVEVLHMNKKTRQITTYRGQRIHWLGEALLPLLERHLKHLFY